MLRRGASVHCRETAASVTAVAGLRYAAYEESLVADGLAIALLGLASVVIAGLSARTLVGIARGDLRALSG